MFKCIYFNFTISLSRHIREYYGTFWEGLVFSPRKLLAFAEIYSFAVDINHKQKADINRGNHRLK